MERFPVTITEYKKGEFIHFMNNPRFRNIVGAYYKKGFANLHGIHGNRREAMSAKYGKQDFVYVGESKNYTWGFKLPSGVIMLIMTGRQGTTYEYLGGNPTMEDLRSFKTFLDWMVETMKEEFEARGIKA